MRLRARVAARLDESGRYPSFVLVAVLSGMFAATFPITIFTASLASIAREFDARETTLAWVLAGPMLVSAVALPLLGKLGDLRGHRRVFLLGTAAAALTAAATCFAWSPASLIGWRTLAATLGGATQPTAMALLFSVTPRETRVRAMGWWSMTAAGAPAIGLVAGGPLVDWLGWRVVFALQAAFCLVALSIGFFVLRETPRRHVSADLPGSLSLALGVAGLMFALGQLRDRSLDSPFVLGALGVGAFGLALFWQVEQRVEKPLLPLALLRERRGFLAPLAANALTSASYMGAFAIAPYLLQRGFGLSITATASVLLLRTAAYALGSPLGGALGVRLGERSAAWIGCLVMLAGIGILTQGALAMHFATVAAGLLLQGLGYGLATPSISSAASNAGHEEDIGITSAVSRMLGSIGAAFGVTLLTLLYGGSDAPRAFAAGGALAFCAWAAALSMKRERAAPLLR